MIAIEGLDNAHKREVAAALERLYQADDQKIVAFRFPTEQTPLGDLLADWQMHVSRDPHTFELLQAADKQEAQALIQTCRDFGTDVFLVSRYIHALYAYGSVDCEPDWLVGLTQHMQRPDIVLYLDVSAETALRRGGYDSDDPATRPERERLEHVRYGYELAFREERLGSVPVLRIDANFPAELVVAQAVTALALELAMDVPVDMTP